MEAAARSVGQQIILVSAGSASEIDTAFGTIARQRAGALLVNGDAFYLSRRDQFVALAARSYRQAGNYVGRILKGAKPADLPVLQAVKFDFAINLKTAKALGIEFPPSFHLRATEVIE
jgi:putative ABC transport system substrate-binding protein